MDDLQKAVWLNTLSNYVRVGLRMLMGLVMFRLLYQGLTQEEFGFWALLWTVFGCGVLSDFGFGLAVQKTVAELSVRQEWERLSRTLSTIFFAYCLIALGLVVLVASSSHALIGFFTISPENREPFRQVMVWFFIGMGFAFPMNIFPEVLRGQQRISLGNTIAMVASILVLASLVVALRWGWGFRSVVIIGLLGVIVPSAVCGLLAFQKMPGVVLRPALFTPGLVRQTMCFSLYAHFIMVSYLILTKTHQIVISSLLAVSAVALYQPGAKVGEYFGLMTRQLSDTLQPAAAHLYARGERKALRTLLLDGMRFSVLIATPLYLICACHMDTVLRLLTGETTPDRVTYWVAQLYTLWCYGFTVTHNVYKRIAVMCGRERELMWAGVVEAIANVVLSVILILKFRSVVSVVVGGLVPSVVIGWFYLWRWAAADAGCTPAHLVRLVLVRNWLSALPLLVFQGVIYGVPAWRQAATLHGELFQIALSVGLAGLGGWFWGLTPKERLRVKELAQRRLKGN